MVAHVRVVFSGSAERSIAVSTARSILILRSPVLKSHVRLRADGTMGLTVYVGNEENGSYGYHLCTVDVVSQACAVEVLRQIEVID